MPATAPAALPRRRQPRSALAPATSLSPPSSPARRQAPRMVACLQSAARFPEAWRSVRLSTGAHRAAERCICLNAKARREAACCCARLSACAPHQKHGLLRLRRQPQRWGCPVVRHRAAALQGASTTSPHRRAFHAPRDRTHPPYTSGSSVDCDCCPSSEMPGRQEPLPLPAPRQRLSLPELASPRTGSISTPPKRRPPAVLQHFAKPGPLALSAAQPRPLERWPGPRLP
mmetsp:Transcript_35268/g.79702  ORF Transcript_35268/g.79702 Transcript_35268/m.79702 type:complete len:230 (-) Transcript_35268:623-1312(-)